MSDALQASGDAADGIVTLPRRAPFWAVCGLALAFGGQVFWAGTYTAGLDSKIAGLTENDLRLGERLASLERDRDRLPKLEERFGRIEEKMSMMIELLRETRQERQGPPKRGG
ncbi:hypothetical protein [Methylorubrum populi]|jgi:hypothetical protein|uniref:Uncharacterized protein n=1 Tax=Methylorubrum populi TaxID=223967 RepID=A0A833J0B0_9HYPH|nr:hypothetical protein [Methylorubrum populi]KAB7782185.1 hypothetical protein F8B43_4940 [Methylorubrum populi]